MAIIMRTASFSHLSGPENGTVYHRSNVGLLASSKTYRRKLLMKPQNSSFSKCLNAFRTMTWTEEMIDFWLYWIHNNPVKNRAGEKRYLTFYQAFLSINIPRVSNDLPVVYVPYGY